VLTLLLFYWLADYTGAFHRLQFSGQNYLNSYLLYLRSTFPILSYLAAIGILLSLKKGRDWSLTSLYLFALLIPLYLVSFHEKRLGFRYLFVSLPLIYILAANTLTYLLDLFKATIQNVSDHWQSKIKGGAKGWQLISGLAFLFLLVVLTFAPALSFQPKQNWYLEPRAPQPKFDSVYDYLNQERQPNTTLIVSYPEVSLWYNQTPNYWLAFSPAGLSVDSWLNANRTHHARTNTPALLNLSQLEQVYQQNKAGYLVLDSLAATRLSPSYHTFLKNKTEWLPGPSKPGVAGAINIYYWQHNTSQADSWLSEN